MNEIEKAIKDLKEYIQLWEDEQADEDLTVIIYKNTIESFKIAKQALEKQINNPLTLDEVKLLKEGDVVWMRFLNNFYHVQIKSNNRNGLCFNCLGDGRTGFYFYESPIMLFYRNKPEGTEEQK